MKMNMPKPSLPLLATALLMGPLNAPAQIDLTENLTVTGFVDMSVLSSDVGGASDTSMGLDRWELDFHFDFNERLSATVDTTDLGEGVFVQQAYIVSEFDHGFSAKAGLFLTPMGYEAAKPIDMWQYSHSATIIGYPGYANGAALMYTADLFSLYASVVDGSYSGDEDANDVSIEGQIRLMPLEGLTLQLGYAREKFDAVPATEEDPGTPSFDQGIINFWAEYATGPLTLAGEYNRLLEIGGPDGDGDGYLLMLNYAFTNRLGLTFRHSSVKLDNGFENTEFTLSPSYAFTDNFLGLLEFRTDEFDDSSQDGESVALELIYSF